MDKGPPEPSLASAAFSPRGVKRLLILAKVLVEVITGGLAKMPTRTALPKGRRAPVEVTTNLPGLVQLLDEILTRAADETVAEANDTAKMKPLSVCFKTMMKR